MSQNESNRDIRLGKYLSLILRHNPQAAGIALDENGWADVEKLISGINRSGRSMTREDLERIVEENNKKRYSFSEDRKKIRANQGHSLPVDVELPEALPPLFLYHGTADRFLKAIRENGLTPGSRRHVHLSADMDTAVNVGKRHGRPVVLRVRSAAMHEKDYVFYLSANGVWLCEKVPAEFIEFDF